VRIIVPTLPGSCTSSSSRQHSPIDEGRERGAATTASALISAGSVAICANSARVIEIVLAAGTRATIASIAGSSSASSTTSSV
jgi:hypothetical protein